MMIGLVNKQYPKMKSFPLLNIIASSFVCKSMAFSTESPSWVKSARLTAEYLKDAKKIIVVTGAGISAESGLPTYRGVTGLYNKNTEEGYSIEECLSSSMYKISPSVTWKYLLQIEKACRGAKPSAAHTLVSKLENHIESVSVMTQNIDGFHEIAGSTNVLNLHGNLYTLRCTSCGSKSEVSSYVDFEEKNNKFPPKCDKCGSFSLRPNVVLFDEYLGDETVSKYEKTLGTPMGQLISSWPLLSRPSYRRNAPFDVSLCIGTSALFGYVNGAALSAKRTIEINPTQTDLSDLVDIHVRGGASEVLEFLFKELGWE